MTTRTNSTLRTAVVALLFVLGCALLCSLGVWQLSRAAEKRARFETFQQRLQAPPVNLDDLLPKNVVAEHAWQRVRLAGHYRDFHVLLDNRVQQGKVGYDVLTPFVTNAGHTVLVDRGWIPLGDSRDVVPDLVAPADPFVLSGFIAAPPVTGIALNEHAADAELMAPRVLRVQQVSLAGIGRQFDFQAWPAVVYLDAGDPGALGIDWPVPGDGSSRHEAYAVQWFAMATILAGIGITGWYRKRKTTA